MSADALYFDVGGQLLVLPAQAVSEVLRAVKVSSLPRAKGCVEGMINLRGAVTPVLSLRRLLGLPPIPMLPQHYLIVTEERRPVALWAESLRGLLPLEAGQMTSLPDEPAAPGCLEGVVNTSLGMALLLQPDALSRVVWSSDSTTVCVTGGAND